MKSELVLLAQKYNPLKSQIAGFYMSEKLDGVRCWWDGGISAGLPATSVPWANVEKHDRYVVAPLATGLWTRYGQPVQAPDGWLANLPKAVMLDGEVWAGHGGFQDVTSAIRKLVPLTYEWASMRYMIFDSPPVEKIFKSRSIDGPNMAKEIVYSQCFEFLKTQADRRGWTRSEWLSLVQRPLDFRDVLTAWSGRPFENGYVSHLEQTKLPNDLRECNKILEARLLEVEANGGEGLMLRRPVSVWTPERSWDLLKVKRRHDMEVEVIGYNWGKQTDKGSKLLGMMGSAICKMDSGRIFELSGFTEAERTMRCIPGLFEDHEGDAGAGLIAGLGSRRSGCRCEDFVEAVSFPRGSRITIKYRELTKDGLPKEAAYFRKAAQ